MKYRPYNSQSRANLLSTNAVHHLCLFLLALVLTVSGCSSAASADDFRVAPYLQNPGPYHITVVWLSNSSAPGTLTYSAPGATPTVLNSAPVPAASLKYHPSEPDPDPGTPYLHKITVTGLSPATSYDYTVRQGSATRSARFKTAPQPNSPIRFVVYADCETEPESTGTHVKWAPPPGASPHRPKLYLVDQTTGYAQNISVIKSRQPDFIIIAGDLVQSGGEQRDWDEFWRHNAGQLSNIASSVPIFPAPGNHDYYSCPKDGYATPAVNAAMEKYLTYFHPPANGAANPAHERRYYRQDYGPVSIIVLDTCNGFPDDSDRDTNWHMASDSNAPDFNLGSPQAQWLQEQLAFAQINSRFTFIVCHNTPYSLGYHARPPGTAKRQDALPSKPVRVLIPMFQKYGVDAIFGGHDEMVERSELKGTEHLPDGATRDNTIHVYDYGVAGDGLRGPLEGQTNPQQKFLAHTDSPERWNGPQLLDGGKHYGHLEVSVAVNDRGSWQAEITPVYVFPLTDAHGDLTGTFERRTYDDHVVITGPLAAEPLEILAPAPQ